MCKIDRIPPQTIMAPKDIPYFTLNNGIKIPSVGMGYVYFFTTAIVIFFTRVCRCWMGEPGGGEKAEQMCRDALKVTSTAKSCMEIVINLIMCRLATDTLIP